MNWQAASSEPKYRNINGVYLRLMNFRSCDPYWLNQGQVGMRAGTKGKCKEIWDEFVEDAELVHELAEQIKAEIKLDPVPNAPETERSEVQPVLEGKRRLRIHYSRERSSQRKHKLQYFQKTHGQIFCEACGENGKCYEFDKKESIFEVHHILPLAMAEDQVITKLDDLAVVCANCHRAIHSLSPLPTIKQFKTLVKA